MNEREFVEMYNTAIKKIAVGFYILDTCGNILGYDADTISKNKKTLCGILAGGNVRLPSDYIVQLVHSGLLEELVESMQFELKQERKIRLQNA